ncbi:type II toxin-antitoxin system RelE/ParE family toxin [Chryseobacterium sp. PBS4-4]|uniref:Type II toxin-antitoxin system RelE/ParE family toxin n=1 Tax=Chryseobacterium edaphi TaxID=2976532 RepID=A0ABT2W5R4_9FLAO|nr:type II toxin-antitoxin system RelE/ParE family toxin [Chryseobacterium edaphi]MCU7617541.1 type II toxin-antitoxin system RelE/ParE family toxin [Chryseobacterium edaphi]
MNIFWTNRAKLDLEILEDFLIDNWGFEVLENFYEILERKVSLLENGYLVHQKYEDTNFHKVLITKHNSIIYEISHNQINLLNMINNFRNPDSNYNLITDK